MSAPTRRGTMEELRSKLEMLRSQQLAIEAELSECQLVQARKRAASQYALMQTAMADGGSPQNADLIAALNHGVSLQRLAEVVLAASADVPIATFEFLGSAGEALVVPVPTSSGLFGESDFWVCIATSSSLQPIGWVRFERRGVFQAKALFEATELRSGDCEAPDPERVLQLWQYLAQGGL